MKQAFVFALCTAVVAAVVAAPAEAARYRKKKIAKQEQVVRMARVIPPQRVVWIPLFLGVAY